MLCGSRGSSGVGVVLLFGIDGSGVDVQRWCSVFVMVFLMCHGGGGVFVWW